MTLYMNGTEEESEAEQTEMNLVINERKDPLLLQNKLNSESMKVMKILSDPVSRGRNLCLQFAVFLIQITIGNVFICEFRFYFYNTL